MSFARKRFLGLTVIDFNCSIGWGDEGTNVTIKLAPEDQEVISSVYKVGDNVEFGMGSFYINGFIDRILEKHDSSGFTYEVKLSDGKEILRNVECIVSSLYGTTRPDEDYAVTNMLNVFRYFESQNFGSSQANENGIPIKYFEEGVNALSLKNMWHNGSQYSVMLDFASKLPKYYRISGPVANLLDVISKICEDLGLLYHITLPKGGNQFLIKTTTLAVSQTNQKVYDTIKAKAQNKDVISWEAGRESTNNIVSNYMIWGGAKHHSVIFKNTSVYPKVKQFWGYDIENKPVYSVFGLNYSMDGTVGATPLICNLGGYAATISSYEASYVDGTKISSDYPIAIPSLGYEDIISDKYYLMKMEELLIIAGGNKENWELYKEMEESSGRDNSKTPYSKIFLKGTRYNIHNIANWMEWGGPIEYVLERNFSEKDKDMGVIRGSRIYGFLKTTIDTYYGKSYLVEMNSYGPLVETKETGLGISPYTIDSQASIIDNPAKGLTTLAKKPGISPFRLDSYNSEDVLDANYKLYNITPNETGWIDPNFLASAAKAIPENFLYGIATNEEGKMGTWVIYQSVGLNNGFSLDNSSADSSFIYKFENSKVAWVKASVSEKYILVYNPASGTNVEHVLVTTTQACYEIGETVTTEGLSNIIACKFGSMGRNGVLGSSQNWKTGLIANPPIQLVLNFRSNRNDFYGPWYIKNPRGGKTTVEQDMTLTPWSFNSDSVFEDAIQKKMSDVQSLEFFETGTFTKVGLPESNIGDELVSNGPVLTSISSSYGSSGVTTQYTFRTFTPKFGLTSRNVIERMKKAALKSYMDRKLILKTYMEAIKKSSAAARGSFGRGQENLVLNFLGRQYDRESPLSLIHMAYSATSPLSSNQLAVRGALTKHKYASPDLFKTGYRNVNENAIASVETIFSPFGNYGSSFNVLSKTIIPNAIFQQSSDSYVPTGYSYNPYKKGTYFSTLLHTSGDNYDPASGAAFGRTSFNAFGKYELLDVHAIAIRGPIMVSGWGTDLFTKETVPFNDSYKNATSLVGPVDLMWDSIRKVWTSHDIFLGKATFNIDGYQVGNPNAELPDGVVVAKTSVQGVLIDEGTAIQVKNIGKEIAAGSPVIAKYSVYDGNWYVEGEGCGIRYSEAECVGVVTPEGNSDFKMIKYIGGDKGSCKDFLCYDLLETNGVSNTVNFPGLGSLRFKNGLLKQVTPSPPPTPTPTPTPTTPCTEPIEIVSGVNCGSDGSITVDKITVNVPCGSRVTPTTTTVPIPYYLNLISDPLASYGPCYSCSTTMGNVVSTHVNQANCLFVLQMMQGSGC